MTTSGSGGHHEALWYHWINLYDVTPGFRRMIRTTALKRRAIMLSAVLFPSSRLWFTTSPKGFAPWKHHVEIILFWVVIPCGITILYRRFTETLQPPPSLWRPFQVILKWFEGDTWFTYLINYLLTYLLTYLITYSMVQSPWEANWFAANQEIPRISRNTCLYPGPAQSSPYTHIPPPGDPS